jgi:hypothetical protein
VLLALVLLPWYRLVAIRAAGPSPEQTLRLGGQYLAAHWLGALLGTVVVMILSRLLQPARMAPLWATIRSWLVRPSAARFAASLAVLAATLSAWISVGVLNRRPILMDGISQLVQARYFSSGRLAGPKLPDPAFWQFQFMVPTATGWVSQYPPGFAALLALGWKVGLAWLAGPVLLGLAVYLTCGVAERLYPEDPVTARTGSGLMAVSFFLAFHAGAYMNHSLATALAAMALFASLRAVDGSWSWALLTGAAVGAIFATRPLVAVTLGFVATVVVWAQEPERSAFTAREWMWRLAGAACGAAPFVIAVLAYNARLFGSPWRFGYIAAAGSAQGLGFHLDPWGNPYGLPEALGYTSADLLGLSLDLLQTPLPAVVVVGIFLLRADRLRLGTRLAAWWALLPVLANALYWHHDLFMGPRMLYEAAPGWCLLLAAAALGLIRDLPQQEARTGLSGFCTRTGVATTFAFALVLGLVLAGPARLMGYAASGRESGMTQAAPTVQQPSLVFVHDDWQSRLGARLAALGMGLDSIRLALRHNSTCQVELFASALEREAVGQAGTVPSPRFDGGPERRLREIQMPSGSRILTYRGEVLAPVCERQAASDYAGIMALAPLLWQGDLPGLDGRGAMFVRDLGPARNAALISRYPGRQPRLLVRRGMAPPRLVPYESGMHALWTIR